MKVLLLAALAMSSLSGWASSARVGTYALYQISGSQKYGTYKVEVSTYNEESDTYVLTYTTVLNKHTTLTQATVAASEVSDQVADEKVVRECAQTQIIQVKEKSYETCKATDAYGVVTYAGAVAFGIVKREYPGADSMVLVDFEYK